MDRANQSINQLKIVNDFNYQKANNALAKAIRAMAKPFKEKVKTKRELTINGFTPEFEKQLLKEIKETEEAYARGEMKTYNSVEEMHRDILK